MFRDALHADEQSLLDAIPEHLSIGDMFKASPVTEGGRRFVYLVASNENLDQQGEVVLAKALEASRDYYLRFGNLDIDHYTQIGAKKGIPNYGLFEIGRPVEVKIHAGETLVKGEIFSGTGAAADQANAFWSSLTDVSPPARWYPSVGGSITGKSVVIDPVSKDKRGVITKVRWTNIGFSKTPVNASLDTITTVPFGALAKSFCAGLEGAADGFDFAKAIEAGYGTDSATLAGGAALRKQSLDRHLKTYWDDRDTLAKMISEGEVRGGDPTALAKAASERLGLSNDKAAAFVRRFLNDLEQHRSVKR